VKILGKGSHMACFAKKREMDGCAPWMKKMVFIQVG